MIRAVTFREFYHDRYKPLKLAAASPATDEQYLMALRALEKFHGSDPPLTSLCDEMIEGLMAWMIGRGRSPATANKTRAHLLAVWRLAVRRQLIAGAPDVDRLGEAKRIPRAWFDWEIATILESAREEPGEICGLPAAAWWRALLLFLYDTGLRISAAMAAEWTQIDWGSKTILIPAETQKHKSDQLLALSDELIEALEAIEAVGSERRLLFPWPFDRHGRQWQTLNRRLRRILARAGLPTGRADMFHKFRKTHASYLKRAGGDPTAQLGHSGPQVTRAYLDPRICTPPRQVDLLPRPTLPAAPG